MTELKGDTMNEETACRSCGRTTTKPNGRWSRAIRHGEPIGWTCGQCPQFGEPILRKVTGAGVRFKVTFQLGHSATGKRRTETKTFLSLKEARDHVTERGAVVRKERNRGSLPVDRTAVTVAQVCDAWLLAKGDDPDVRPNTLETYRHNVKPIRRLLGDRKVQRLSTSEVIKFVKVLPKAGGSKGQGLGKHSTRATIAVLKGVLDHAVSDGLIVVNPARDPKVKLPKINSAESVDELERWTAAEMVKFTKFADDKEHAVGWRLIALGLRREEVLGLKWDAVDLDAGTIRIKRSRVKVSRSTDARGWVVGEVKTHGSKHNASLRTVHPDEASPGTMRMLRELKMAALDKRGFVVVDRAGEPVQPDTFSNQFSAMCRAAQVPVIHVHSTRHTIAYLLHEAGLPPVRAAAFLGHSLDAYLGIYLFARSDDVTVAGQVLGDVLRSATLAS